MPSKAKNRRFLEEVNAPSGNVWPIDKEMLLKVIR